jgi:4-hydroxy-tetrahydrodipicolinate synthase
MSDRIHGVLAPVLTPFNKYYEPDTNSFINHCRWLIENKAGLAIFGTNSEAASLSVAERLNLTDAILEAGIPANKLMPGTGACSITDAITLTSHAVRNGAAGVLMLPPFYYKSVSDQGLYNYYSEIIEKVANDKLRIYLYHIPQVSGVPITLNLIEMLRKKYPNIVVGIKDSSGDWNNTQAIINGFSKDGFDVFPGSETFLLKALKIGGVGCISATANMNPSGINAIFEGWNQVHADALQADADVIRGIFQAHSMIPAMKRYVAEVTGNPEWRVVRPPLTQIDEEVAKKLLTDLNLAKFSMPNYPK